MDTVFELLFAGMAVFNSFGLFVISFAFSTIGGCMVFADFYSRRQSKKVVAKIIGLEISERKGGNMYYPIYRYKNLAGETVEKKADWDSNTLLNNLPGGTGSLLLNPVSPDKIQQNTRIFAYVGLLFLLPGLFVFSEALKTIEFKVPYLLAACSVILYFIFKIQRFLARIGWSKIKEEIKKSRKEGKPWFTINSGENKDLKDGFTSRPMSSGEIQTIALKEKKRFKISAFFLILASAALFFFSQYTGLKILNLQTNGLRAEGEVVDFKISSDSDSTTYTAVFAFTSAQGESIRKKDSFGSSHPTLKLGETVPILYDPQKPDNAIIDRGVWNWFLSALLAFIGVLCVTLAVSLLQLVFQASRL